MAAMPPLNNSATKSAADRPSYSNSSSAYRNRRIEHFHKKSSIDETITAATSSGSSVSQPRRGRVVSPTSSRAGSVPIKDSVIFQKSAGLSKWLAPPSPGGTTPPTKPLSAPSSPTTATRYANTIRRQRLAQRSSGGATNESAPSSPATPNKAASPASSGNVRRLRQRPSAIQSPPRETAPMKMTHTTTVAAAMISAAASRRLEQNARTNHRDAAVTYTPERHVAERQRPSHAASPPRQMQHSSYAASPPRQRSSHAYATSPPRQMQPHPSSPPSSAHRRYASQGPPLHSESPVARVRQQPSVPYSYSEASSVPSHADVALVPSLSSRDRYESIQPPPLVSREYRSHPQNQYMRGDRAELSPHRPVDLPSRHAHYSPQSQHHRGPRPTQPHYGAEPPLLPAIANERMAQSDRHPAPHEGRMSQQPYPRRPRRRIEEEKKYSEHHARGLPRSASSSDYETDTSRGDHRFAERSLHYAPSNTSQMTPTGFLESSKSVRDDDTYDYGDRDDDSQRSLSYEQRRQKMEREQEARAAAVAAAKAELDGPFMQKDDVEHYRKVVDTPLGRTAAGAAAAATVGCILLGPVGIILGVAAVGIGVGYMQIPEEQRQNMTKKVQEAVKSAQESALDASETLSNTCLASYKDSGIAEHVPVEIETCCVSLAGMEGGAPDGDLEDDSLVQRDGEGEEGEVTNKKSEYVERRKGTTPTHHSSWLREKKEKVSVLRKGKIIPLTQIHALDPSMQPRAWLDVLASADTTADEKIEASEEILILAKDKQKSRVFVDEGILDCLLWTIGRYLEKERRGPGSEHWAHPEITREETAAVKLAAQCCVTLGKSYCAAIHTEGDLLLMSLYDRGTVPEERQLAQMLLEVPHHARSTVTNDPTIVTPGKESFTVQQMTLSQAEELAAVITNLAKGRNV